MEKKKDIDMYFLVPNRNIFRSHLKAGLKVFSNLDFIGKFSFERKEHNCIKITSFNSDFDKFYQRITQKSNFIVNKDSNYLNWRYVQRPDRDYQIYTVMKDDEINRISPVVKDCMENAIELGIPLKANIELTKNWGDIH